MRRVHGFAAPFVVTAALTGCEDTDRAKPKPPPPPPTRPDAAMSHNPPMPRPDADTRPEAPAGATTIDTGLGCIVWPHGDQDGGVKCPAIGATITMATPTARRDGITFDPWTMTCMQFFDMSCDPDTKCNPPPPQRVPCPNDLMPTLRADLEPIRRDTRCLWHVAGGEDLEVACTGGTP